LIKKKLLSNSDDLNIKKWMVEEPNHIQEYEEKNLKVSIETNYFKMELERVYAPSSSSFLQPTNISMKLNSNFEF
jgi:hypothetical protein